MGYEHAPSLGGKDRRAPALRYVPISQQPPARARPASPTTSTDASGLFASWQPHVLSPISPGLRQGVRLLRGSLAHAAFVKMLLTVITVPSVNTYVHQRSTDLSVRFRLAGLSASALHGVPCACPATSQTITDWL